MIFPRSSLRCLLGFALCGAGVAAERVSEKPAGLPITLEKAYDRALESDQSIRIAYWEVRKANLLPWSALTRLGPQVFASGGYNRSEQFRKATVTETEALLSNTPGVPATARTERVERTTRSAAGVGRVDLTFEQPLIDLSVFPAYRGGKI